MNESALQTQMDRSCSPLPQDVPAQVSNEDEEPSVANLMVVTEGSSEAPCIAVAEGLHLHLNPRAKSGYTRVESLISGRFRVAVASATSNNLQSCNLPCMQRIMFCMRRASTPSTPSSH